MKLRKTYFYPKTSWLIIAIWLTLAGCAVTKQGNEGFYFMQMTDTQFGFFNENKSFEQETEHFRKAIGEANRLKPAFVIVTGDLVNKPFDSAQIAEYKRIAGDLDSRIPLYNLPGNHDVGNTPTPGDIVDYKKEFGPDYYTFRHQSMLGIVLNSMYLKDPQHVPEEALAQEQWLIQTLKEAKAQRYHHIIVFLHHPLFLNQEDEADQYFNIPLATRKRYLELFRASGIRYTFAGHLHRNAHAKTGEEEMVTTGPVGKPLGADPSGLRIIRIQGNNIRHQYFSLDSIPDQVSF